MRQSKFWFVVSGILAVLAMALMLPTSANAVTSFTQRRTRRSFHCVRNANSTRTQQDPKFRKSGAETGASALIHLSSGW